MPDLTHAVSTIANLPTSPVGPVPARDGEYARLFALQASGYTDGPQDPDPAAWATGAGRP